MSDRVVLFRVPYTLLSYDLLSTPVMTVNKLIPAKRNATTVVGDQRSRFTAQPLSTILHPGHCGET